MRSHRCHRADSVSCLSNSLNDQRLDRISTASRGFALALGLVGMVINVIGSEKKIASAEGEVVSDHRLTDGNQSSSSREAIPPAPSNAATAGTPSTTSSLEGALQAGRIFLPETLQRFATTLNWDSNVFDVRAGERELTLSAPIGLGSAGTSLKRQKSLIFLNYPFDKRARTKVATLSPNAARDMAGTQVPGGTSFEGQTQKGFRAALRPDLVHLVSSSAFVANSPGRTAAPLAVAQESLVFGRWPDRHAPTLGANSDSSFEKRDWNVPARAAAAYSSATPMVAATTESGKGGETLASPDDPAFALSSGLLASHLTFGANGARLSGNGTIAGNVVLNTSLGIAPGNSPGLLTMAGGLTWSHGGFFELEIQDTAGAPGTGWDAIHVNGILQFTATLGEPFTVHLSSLTGSGASGNISNFLASRPYALQVLTATGGINGFNPSAVRITTTGFTNALDGGSFAILASGDELMLTFTPVPEPSTWALMLTGASVLAMKFMRRRRRAGAQPTVPLTAAG